MTTNNVFKTMLTSSTNETPQDFIKFLEKRLQNLLAKESSSPVYSNNYPDFSNYIIEYNNITGSSNFDLNYQIYNDIPVTVDNEKYDYSPEEQQKEDDFHNSLIRDDYSEYETDSEYEYDSFSESDSDIEYMSA